MEVSEAQRALPPDMLDRLLAIRRENLIEVSQPLVVIAQPNRSGGTLLSQLFDAHPELHALPGELKFRPAYPELHALPGELKFRPAWPSLDVADPPQALCKALQPKILFHAFRDGYSKDRPAQKLGHHEQLEQFPFMLPPSLYRNLFLELAAERTIESQRDALDVHFTALFNAWLDNQNLYGGPKRWVVAFRGRMRHPENLAAFVRDYPDGRHITCVREPKARIASWLAYMRGRAQDPDLGGVELPEEHGPEAWRRATELQIEAKERHGERVFLLTFEQLITETEQTMRALAAWLGIRFDPILTQPTFNRLPIKANSSYAVGSYGVLREPLENWRGVLSDEQAKLIDAQTSDLYKRVCELTGR